MTNNPIQGQTNCVFRSKRPVNPIYADHRFRSMATTRERSKAGDSIINQVVGMVVAARTFL